MAFKIKIGKCLLVVFFAFFFTACSSTPEPAVEAEYNQPADGRDPFEKVNRAIWDFNYDVLDKHVLRPTAVVYRDYMPVPVRKGLVNLVNNLDEPSAFINNTLQGKFTNAGISAGRFILNTTVGVFGVFDIATPMGLEEQHEDFGEVLGSWGVGNGPYLMLPAMGPSDLRDTTGNYVDGLYFPLADLTIWGSLGRVTVKALEGRIQLMDQEQMLNDSFDPYLFVKEAHFQRSVFKVNDGAVMSDKDDEGFDDFEDDFDEFSEDLE